MRGQTAAGGLLPGATKRAVARSNPAIDGFGFGAPAWISPERAHAGATDVNQERSKSNITRAAASAKAAATPAPDAAASAIDAWMLASRVSITGLFVIAIIGALYLSRSITMPVIAAVLVGATMRPIQKRGADYHIPPVLTAIAIIALFAAVMYGIVILVVNPLSDWVSHAPDFGSVIKQKFGWLDRPLRMLRDLHKSMGSAGGEGQTVSVETSLTSIAQQALGFLTPAISEFLVFFGTLMFFLVGSSRLRRKFISLFASRDNRLRVMRIWSDVEGHLVSYIGTVSVINVGLGVVTGVMLYLIGFPNPATFGALAFVLNYVPYIGPALLVTMLFAVGLVSMPSLGGALLAPALFVALTTVEGQIITPSIVGHRLTMSPLAVFLSLAFWAWLWGPLGTFIATPILIIALVLIEHFSEDDDPALPK
jgi:predicted PurR-regulated permease PerM